MGETALGFATHFLGPYSRTDFSVTMRKIGSAALSMFTRE